MSTPQSQAKVTTNTGNNPLLARAYALSYGDTNTARALYDEWASQFDADMADTSRDYVAPAIASATLLSTLIKIYSSSSSPVSPNSSQPSSPSRSESDRTSSPTPAAEHHAATTNATTKATTTTTTTDQISSLSLPETLTILDAGCGTGLVGQHLSTTLHPLLSTSTTTQISIDGIDLSPKMLEIARTKSCYRNLNTADLSVSLPTQQFPDEMYDAIVCVGTLTHGHVGPHAIAEFVRLVKREKGVVVTTVLGDIYVSGGYEKEVRRLEKEGEVEVIGEGLEEYRRADGVMANMVVLRRK